MSFGGYGYGGYGMRYGQEPELAIQTPSMLQPVIAAQNIEKGELERAEGQLQLQEESQLAPLKMQAARQQAQAETQAAYHQSIGQIATDTLALDPDQRASYWDEQMGAQAKQGNPLASQYLGHYRGDLAQNVADVYAGPAQGTPRSRGGAAQATSGFDPAMFNRALDQVPAAQLPTMLQRQNDVIDGFNRVHDEQSWNDEVARLRESGIPVDKMFNPNASWQVNYAQAARLLQNLVPMRDAVAQRVLAQSTGTPVPAAPPLFKPSFHPLTSVLGPGGRPLAVDETTGQFIQGPAGASFRPTGQSGINTFEFKRQAWLSAHPGDDQGALNYAGGKNNKQLEPAQIREYANNQALREWSDLEMSGEAANVPNREAWISARSDDYYNQMISANAGAQGARQGTAPQSGMVLPQRAMSAVKAANGKPTKFNNGQTWVWRGGKAVRVQ